MPKLSSEVPRYRRHKASGQAVVRLQGRDFYLGKYGTAASREAYQRWLAEWSQNSCRVTTPPTTTTLTELVIALPVDRPLGGKWIVLVDRLWLALFRSVQPL